MGCVDVKGRIVGVEVEGLKGRGALGEDVGEVPVSWGGSKGRVGRVKGGGLREMVGLNMLVVVVVVVVEVGIEIV